MNKRILAIIFLIAVIAIVGFQLANWSQATDFNTDVHYTGRDSCIECHQQQADLFHGSDHDLAMDVATDESVLADFDDQSLEHFGVTTRMFREGEKFMVNTEGPTGEMEDFEVKYVFGVRPLQQYMVEVDRPVDATAEEIGRVQVLRVSWDTGAKKWFHLNPPDVNEKLDPDDPLHWTGITQNWNTSCAECHSTDLKKNFNPLTGDYHTTFSEIDVSCEACHGPGSLHVEIANAKRSAWDRKLKYGLVKLKTESNLPQIQACAPCHSRRTVLGEGYTPGCNFDDYFATQVLAQPVYHADGQIRDEDYVYGSFVQSKMFHNGIRCSDCHDPHSAKVKFTDNQLCTSCHQHPAGKYDSPSHHHHQPGTPGASCVECHMPATTYMAVDPRRDHSLRVPRPDLSVRLGTPNACTACHIDEKTLPIDADRKPLTQYLDWLILAEEGDAEIETELQRVNRLMLDATEKWYPREQSPPLTKYYEQLAIGRSDTEASLPTLNQLAVDRNAPWMMRASALNDLADDPDPQSLETAMAALEDDDPNVIAAALMRLDGELGRLASRQRYGGPDQNAATQQSEATQDLRQLRRLTTAIGELMSHPSRRVRIEAARVFVNIAPEARQNFADSDQRRAFELALDEYKKSLYAKNDRAVFHMMLGGLHEMLGDTARAKEDYGAAISVEPNQAGLRSNLAALLDAEARQLRNRMRQSSPEGGISAGEVKKLFAQMQKLSEQSARLRAEEHALLAKDIRRSAGLQNTHGLHYRFAMSSYVQNDLAATEKHLLEAHRQQPENPMYLMGLATYYLHVQNPGEAAGYINELVKQDPQHEGYRQLEVQAQQMLRINEP